MYARTITAYDRNESQFLGPFSLSLTIMSPEEQHIADHHSMLGEKKKKKKMEFGGT